jgi:small subunit ribosomal protein S8
MFNDPISDLLTRIRNAINVKHQIVKITFSNLILKTLIIFKNENLIQQFHYLLKHNIFIILLKYYSLKQISAIKTLIRLSKPSFRLYLTKKQLITKKYREMVNYKQGIFIISTPFGIMTITEALKLQLGGELLCFIS